MLNASGHVQYVAENISGSPGPKRQHATGKLLACFGSDQLRLVVEVVLG